MVDTFLPDLDDLEGLCAREVADLALPAQGRRKQRHQETSGSVHVVSEVSDCSRHVEVFPVSAQRRVVDGNANSALDGVTQDLARRVAGNRLDDPAVVVLVRENVFELAELHRRIESCVGTTSIVALPAAAFFAPLIAASRYGLPTPVAKYAIRSLAAAGWPDAPCARRSRE